MTVAEAHLQGLPAMMVAVALEALLLLLLVVVGVSSYWEGGCVYAILRVVYFLQF